MDGGPWRRLGWCRKVGSKTGCLAGWAYWSDPGEPPGAGSHDSWQPCRRWAPGLRSVGRGQNHSGIDVELHLGSAGPSPEGRRGEKTGDQNSNSKYKENVLKMFFCFVGFFFCFTKIN